MTEKPKTSTGSQRSYMRCYDIIKGEYVFVNGTEMRRAKVGRLPEWYWTDEEVRLCERV